MVEGPVSDSRDVVLARVRAALGTPPPSLPEIPRAYGRAVARPLVDLFCERAGEYRAAVRRVAPATLADAVAEATEGLDDDVALTGCTLAIATTGTIVLDDAPRAQTLLPDNHVCVVRADEIVADVPAAIAALEPLARAGRPITFVSGPSATSDIELERVEGVHGPRNLTILVVDD